MSDFGQRQRHGVTKKLVEGIGGLIVGAAAVLLLRQWLRPRPADPNRAQVQAQTPPLASTGAAAPPTRYALTQTSTATPNGDDHA